MDVDDANACEQAGAEGTMGTTYISGRTFRLKEVTYRVHAGQALVEGDIVLGPVDLVERAKAAVDKRAGDLAPFGVVISGPGHRWPDKKIYYAIDPHLPRQERVTDAIKHWEEKTQIRFVKRGKEKNYVTFKRGSGCSSSIGMVGGQQFVSLGDECSTGNAIHEIGHVVGLFHEQSREDRDEHVEIKWANIQNGKQDQFKQHITDGDDVGAYDFASIMHYPANAFAKDPRKPTIVTKPAGQPIGQRKALSEDDVYTVGKIYP